MTHSLAVERYSDKVEVPSSSLGASTEAGSRRHKTLVAVQAASPDTYCADGVSAEDLEKETPIRKGLSASLESCWRGLTGIFAKDVWGNSP